MHVTKMGLQEEDTAGATGVVRHRTDNGSNLHLRSGTMRAADSPKLESLVVLDISEASLDYLKSTESILLGMRQMRLHLEDDLLDR
jgi:hypothetical protein